MIPGNFPWFNHEVKKGAKAHRCAYCDRIIPQGSRFVRSSLGRIHRCFCNEEHANRFGAGESMDVTTIGAQPQAVIAYSDYSWMSYSMVALLIKGKPCLYADLASNLSIGMTLNGKTLDMEEWDTPIPLRDGTNIVAKKDGTVIFKIEI